MSKGLFRLVSIYCKNTLGLQEMRFFKYSQLAATQLSITSCSRYEARSICA